MRAPRIPRSAQGRHLGPLAFPLGASRSLEPQSLRICDAAIRRRRSSAERRGSHCAPGVVTNRGFRGTEAARPRVPQFSRSAGTQESPVTLLGPLGFPMRPENPGGQVRRCARDVGPGHPSPARSPLRCVREHAEARSGRAVFEVGRGWSPCDRRSETSARDGRSPHARSVAHDLVAAGPRGGRSIRKPGWWEGWGTGGARLDPKRGETGRLRYPAVVARHGRHNVMAGGSETRSQRQLTPRAFRVIRRRRHRPRGSPESAGLAPPGGWGSAGPAPSEPWL